MFQAPSTHTHTLIHSLDIGVAPEVSPDEIPAVLCSVG